MIERISESDVDAIRDGCEHTFGYICHAAITSIWLPTAEEIADGYEVAILKEQIGVFLSYLATAAEGRQTLTRFLGPTVVRLYVIAAMQGRVSPPTFVPYSALCAHRFAVEASLAVLSKAMFDVSEIAVGFKYSSSRSLDPSQWDLMSDAIESLDDETTRAMAVALPGIIEKFTVGAEQAKDIHAWVEREAAAVRLFLGYTELKAAGTRTYPNPKNLRRDKFLWENILTMNLSQLILAQKSRKNFGLKEPIATLSGIKRAALQYSDYHKLPTRNFKTETPYVEAAGGDTD